MFSHFRKEKGGKAGARGFTLFEMMVAISIFVIITTLGVLNYRKFNNDIFITNLAYDIALSIRKAQAYGINVRGQGGNFNYSYGVNFNSNGLNEQKKYTLFVDTINNDGLYNAVAERVENYTLLKGSRVDKLYCSADGINAAPCSGSILNISFTRPKPDAVIKGNNAATYSMACIYIKSNDGRSKQIVVYSVGNISVTDNAPDVGCGAH